MWFELAKSFEVDVPMVFNNNNIDGSPFDVVHCYGIVHHLDNPEQALEFTSRNTVRILFLETRVSFGESEEINIVREPQTDPTQAYSGIGCRPTRLWLFN